MGIERQAGSNGTPLSAGVGGASRRDSSSRLRILKWTTVALPVIFVAAVSYAGHFVVPTFTLSLPGFLGLMVILSIGAYLFSCFVFGRIERAEQEANSRHQEMLMLKSVSAASVQPVRLEQLLQTAVDNLVDLMCVDGSIVCVLDDEPRELRHVAYRGIPDDMLGPLKKIKLDDDLVGAEVVSTGEPIYIKDTSKDPRLSSPGRRSIFRSLLILPLKFEGQVRGVMVLASRSELVLDSSQIQFLLTLGSQLAVAIETSQLQQQVADVAVLEERERIAREMHDGLAQVLGYINAKTSAISRLLSDGNIEDAKLEIGGLREKAREVYGDVRESILGLRFASVRAGTLSDNLREYCESFAKLSGIAVVTNGLDGIASDMEMAVDIQVRRIVQEALTNVRRHAQVDRVAVSATQSENTLHLLVEDEGVGFDLDRLEEDGCGHYGIQTMQERAASVGGELHVESSPGSGAKVMMAVPLKAQNGRL